MSILGMQGFEGRDDNTSRCASASNFYSTTVPPLSSSTRSISNPFFVLSELGIASGPQWHMKGTLRLRDLAGTRTDVRLGMSADGIQDDQSVSVSLAATGEWTLRVAGVVVVTSAVQFVSFQWETFLLKVDQTSGGLIEVFLVQDLVNPIMTHTVTPAEAAALNPPTHFLARAFNAFCWCDDLIAITPDAVFPQTIEDIAAHTIAPVFATGPGDNSEWSGTAADIDELPFSAADTIGSNAPDQQTDFTWSDRTEDEVVAVRVLAGVIRSGTDAGENIQVYQRKGGVEVSTPSQSAPPNGVLQFILDTDADGNPFTTANFNATNFGVESKT